MLLPHPRGPISEQVLHALATDGRPPETVEPTEAVLHNADLQLTLWVLFELQYRGFEDVPDGREWDEGLLRLRRELSDRLETQLRALTCDQVATALVAPARDFADRLFGLIDDAEGPSVAGYLQREADRDQLVDFMRQRSIYHLKESDPHSFVLATLEGPAKTALAELQYDEYGSGVPERLHQALFAAALEGCGLSPSYGAYIDQATALTLATSNTMSLFALQRRLRGAAMGHLAAFEATSSVPCRKISRGITRLGLPDAVAAYFDEHVEADSVHEQLACRHICAAMVAQEPRLAEQVLFGAACCLTVDALAGEELLARWRSDQQQASIAVQAGREAS